MEDSKILKQFLEEQHNKWKKSAFDSIIKGNNIHPEYSQTLKQNNPREPVASNSTQGNKKEAIFER